MKATIIGGGGRVGSCAAFALQHGRVLREIALIDANEDAAKGEALDLLHGAPLVADQTFVAGGYEHVADSDFVIITAGLRRQPNEPRLALVNRNVALFRQILKDCRSAGLRETATVVVVSNPVDILTKLAVEALPLPWRQVLGLGTLLDTARFRGLIADRLDVPATQVNALILGEHGDSMTPIWSSATVAGLRLQAWPGFRPNMETELFERAKTSGAEMLKTKGGAGFAVGVAIAELVHSVALDQRRVLPVSSLVRGKYGDSDVCLSVPVVLGRGGAIEQIELELWPKEAMGLQRSAQALSAVMKELA